MRKFLVVIASFVVALALSAPALAVGPPGHAGQLDIELGPGATEVRVGADPYACMAMFIVEGKTGNIPTPHGADIDEDCEPS